MSFKFFHERLPFFIKIFIYVIRTLSLIFLWKISILAQRVHVSEILRHFSQLYPTHSRLVYDPTGTILVILYREVPHMLPAEYQPNPPGGSKEEDFWMVYTIYELGGHLEFRIKTILTPFINSKTGFFATPAFKIWLIRIRMSMVIKLNFRRFLIKVSRTLACYLMLQ